jgi:hypothetical protein
MVFLFWLMVILVGPTRLTLIYLMISLGAIKFVIAPFMEERPKNIVMNNNTTFFVVVGMFLTTMFIGWLDPSPEVRMTLWEKAKALGNSLIGKGPAPEIIPSPLQVVWGWVNYMLFSDKLGAWTWATWVYGVSAVFAIPVCFWDEFWGKMKMLWSEEKTKRSEAAGHHITIADMFKVEVIAKVVLESFGHVLKTIFGFGS